MKFPFFTRELLYYFIKQGYITFTPVYRPGKTLAVREFVDEEQVKLEGLLLKYQQKREAGSELAEYLDAAEEGSGRRRVLVVEDQPLHVQFLQEGLGGDFDVEVATTTSQAKEALGGAKVFDAAIIDLALPESRGGQYALMSGLEVVKQAQANGLPLIIVLSARISAGLAADLKKQNVAVYKKPVRAKSLVEFLRVSFAEEV
jgi:CheY-like chemotaxis protein